MTDAQIFRLKPGQVIVSPGGFDRTVLAVKIGKTLYGSKPKVGVYVAILRCSWTKRPTTVLDMQMLRRYKATKRTVDFKRLKLGRLAFEDCVFHNQKGGCCKVIGKFQ